MLLSAPTEPLPWHSSTGGLRALPHKKKKLWVTIFDSHMKITRKGFMQSHAKHRDTVRYCNAVESCIQGGHNPPAVPSPAAVAGLGTADISPCRIRVCRDRKSWGSGCFRKRRSSSRDPPSCDRRFAVFGRRCHASAILYLWIAFVPFHRPVPLSVIHLQSSWKCTSAMILCMRNARTRLMNCCRSTT